MEWRLCFGHVFVDEFLQRVVVGVFLLFALLSAEEYGQFLIVGGQAVEREGCFGQMPVVLGQAVVGVLFAEQSEEYGEGGECVAGPSHGSEEGGVD